MKPLTNEKFKDFITAAKRDNRILYDPEFYGEYIEILRQLYSDVQDFDICTLDGRFEDLLIKITNGFIFTDKINYYNEFLNKIYSEFDKLIVPNMILIPLNNIEINFKNDDYIQVTNNVRIYRPINNDKKKFNFLRSNKIKRDSLSEYFEKNVYMELSKEHILLTKDPNFF